MSVSVDTPSFAAARERLVRRFDAATLAPWWEALPASLASMADEWALALGEPVGHGETAVVLPARLRDSGTRAFLKLTPSPRLSDAEAWALDHWASTGRVPLVPRRDVARGALLLAAVPAARSVGEAGDEPSLEAVGALVQALHRVPAPAPASFEPLVDRAAFLFDLWDERLGRTRGGARTSGPGSEPAGERVGLLDRGRALMTELCADAPAPVLLHGDLHPGNVFDAGGDIGLMAIDPRPCIGDAGFDLIDWIVRGEDDPAVWRTRATHLAELTGADPDRAWAWCQAFAAMLAAIEAGRRGSARRVAALLEIAA